MLDLPLIVRWRVYTQRFQQFSETLFLTCDMSVSTTVVNKIETVQKHTNVLNSSQTCREILDRLIGIGIVQNTETRFGSANTTVGQAALHIVISMVFARQLCNMEDWISEPTVFGTQYAFLRCYNSILDQRYRYTSHGYSTNLWRNSPANSVMVDRMLCASTRNWASMIAASGKVAMLNNIYNSLMLW